MSNRVDLTIQSGLPFKKTIVVTLPADRDWWTVGDEFEVLAQIREKQTSDSCLLLDLAKYLTTTFTAPDTVTIYWVMSGAETRELKMSGYYDVVMSDVDVTDERAYVIMRGRFSRTSVITAEKEET